MSGFLVGLLVLQLPRNVGDNSREVEALDPGNTMGLAEPSYIIL
jgi:hypothetical protein